MLMHEATAAGLFAAAHTHLTPEEFDAEIERCCSDLSGGVKEAVDEIMLSARKLHGRGQSL